MDVKMTGEIILLDPDGLATLREVGADQGRDVTTPYRVVGQDDGTMILYPISDLEAAMWRSGLMARIEESSAHPERMVEVTADDL
jgi:hypothetical protein